MELNEYQQETQRFARYPGQGGTLGLVYCALLTAEEAGECAGKIAKMLRDNDGVMTDAIRQAIKFEIGDALWGLSQLATEADITLDGVAQANLEKLESRRQRNVISGSGDER